MDRTEEGRRENLGLVAYIFCEVEDQSVCRKKERQD